MTPETPDIASPKRVLTPSSLNALARETIERAFPLVLVEGELSNVSRPSSGHVYFTLKDAQAQVRCALFRNRAMYLRFKPADGMQVLLRGKVSFYEPRGEFQLIVDHLEPAGEGALRREFERLKAKLASEGLFDTERKKPLPKLPRRIAVITSATGAAIHDVLSVWRRRYTLAEIDILPVPVQGAGAARQIETMLTRADAAGRYDVILVTRGGGSLEDLWEFNDEQLARAASRLRTPLVSAIGHEVDFTLLDFVADLRAPTPSAAAELIAPALAELNTQLLRHFDRLRQAIDRRWRTASQRVDRLGARLQGQRPSQRLALSRSRLGNLHPRLIAAMRALPARERQRLLTLRARLAALDPAQRLRRLRDRLQSLQARQARAIAQRLQQARARGTELARTLHAVGPLATLDRGYALIRDEHGRVVRAAGDVAVDQIVEATLAEGQLRLRVLARDPE